MRRLLAVALVLPILACNYNKPAMDTALTNRSGQSLRNIEVRYPGGIYGITLLDDGKNDRRQVILTPPCQFSFSFEDPNGKTLPARKLDLGKDCPKQANFAITSGMQIERVDPTAP